MSRFFITIALLVAFAILSPATFAAKPLPLNKALRCGGCVHVVNRMKEEQQKLPATQLHAKHRIDERKSANPIPFNRSEQALYEIFDQVANKDNANDLSMLEMTLQHKVLPKNQDHRSTSNETITKALKYVLSELQQHDEEFISAFKRGTDDTDYVSDLCHKTIKYCPNFEFGEVIYTPPPPPEDEEKTEQNDKTGQNEKPADQADNTDNQAEESTKTAKDEL